MYFINKQQRKCNASKRNIQKSVQTKSSVHMKEFENF